MIESIDDAYYMRLALELAAKAQGQTGINPVVGCVLVKDGRIVGIGTHLARGGGHAEVHALGMAGDAAEGATAYVTLEPCSHYGKTPPCADRLIAAKVARVVVAATDPNPNVSGEGLAKLRAAGIDAEAGLLEAESRSLNEAFEKYITTGLPFVTLKSASTLDGRIAAKTGDSRWVTSSAAREAVHALRHRHDAIMVGAETAAADDPSLTTRLPVPGLHPIRIVVDAKLRLPESLRMFNDREAPTIVLTTSAADRAKCARLASQGVELLTCGDGPRVDLRSAMEQLGQREISSILLEGGGKLNGAMLEAGFVDKAVLFYAAKIIGGGGPGLFDFGGFERMSEAIRLERVTVESYGDDWCVTGYPVYGGE